MSQVATGRRLAGVAVLALGGCNPIFGIDQTILIDAAPPGLDAADVDLDDDFVLDVIDNCEAIPNPMQEDADDDGIGDACDACMVGSNHNEDGDAFLDGCDVCPHIANDDQADADGDGVGDACERFTGTIDRRVRFDSFHTLGTDWTPGAVLWKSESDAVLPVSDPPDDDLGLWNRYVLVSGAQWMIEIRVRLGTPMQGETLGLWTRTDVGGSSVPCFIQYDLGLWTLSAGAATAPVTITGDTVTFRVTRANFAGVTCSAGDAEVPVPVPRTETYPGFFMWSDRHRVEYIEAIATTNL